MDEVAKAVKNISFPSVTSWRPVLSGEPKEKSWSFRLGWGLEREIKRVAAPLGDLKEILISEKLAALLSVRRKTACVALMMVRVTELKGRRWSTSNREIVEDVDEKMRKKKILHQQTPPSKGLPT